MVVNKSLDKYKLIAALLHDIHMSRGDVFTTRSLRLTCQKVENRLRREGIGFLTKTLPRLGKAFDKALAEVTPLNGLELGFKTLPGSKLPKLFGELFSRVLKPDGTTLPDPCINCVKHLRDILYLFYKYEVPYTDEQEQQVLEQFERTERELETVTDMLRRLGERVDDSTTYRRRRFSKTTKASPEEIVREARILFSRLFAFFDPKNIHPRHGPGAVATKQRLWDKYNWTNVSAKITKVYPLDAYYFASLGHVCDRMDTFFGIHQEDLPARVLLVPKDSRGPRLISCEPVDYQWIQQGLGQALVRLAETHDLTRYCVFFTDQVPNRIAAIYGSETGKYATLDLNEASDRVTLELVRLLYPPHIYEYLSACRSSSTVLPDGLILPLYKFAPMGSSLCFPILALTIWSLLTAAVQDADTREGIHVYGDDVIVPTAYAGEAIERLESFGLKINQDKSCIKGFFRESCGMDAYKGICVTPVRLRTVWSSSPTPEAYTSWVAYANQLWNKQYYSAYDYVVGLLHHVYGAIPAKDMLLTCPSLEYVPEDRRPKRFRINHFLQKKEWKVWDVKSPSIIKVIDGWSMLLRYFSERTDSTLLPLDGCGSRETYVSEEPFSVSSYTRRKTSMLVKRWR